MIIIYAFPVEKTESRNKPYNFGGMKKQDIDKIISEIDSKDTIFANKQFLDTISFPDLIIGRERPVKRLVKFFLEYKKGHVVPFVSVFGRSGSGKSSTVKFVCQNMDGISYCFVNLRKAKTIFGAANLILSELGKENLKSAQGLNSALEIIEGAIIQLLQREEKKLFVLVLDEYDMIFSDKRNSPSDFIFKLVVMQQDLKEKGFFACIVAISNNALLEYELDSRVRSRIGNSEIFFEPYPKSVVLDILKDRASKAFSGEIDDKVLQYCSEISSSEHGDARRAIDLLRVAGEIADSKGEKLDSNHVDLAQASLDKDRVVYILGYASLQLKNLCLALARVTFLTEQGWHATSQIYEQYQMMTSIIKPPVNLLSYRRISMLLTEIENMGLVVSQTSSKGRHGYGTSYKLTVAPLMIGNALAKDWWKSVVAAKAEYDDVGHHARFKHLSDAKFEKLESEKYWKDYLGLD
jgi:cell division control protein 6